MKQKKLGLLECLRENSREKLTSISRKTHIPISTLFDMLKELQDGIIQRCTILLNFEELGYHTRAHVFIKVDSDDKERLQRHLQLHGQVNTLQKTNNGWNFIVEFICKNIKELDKIIEKIKVEYRVGDLKIHYLIEDIKKEGFTIQTSNDGLSASF